MKSTNWLILPLVLLCAGFNPQRALAATGAASCSSSDVQNAINSASSGDTITVPAGTCSWSTAVTIPNTKGITLDGGGRTTITGQLVLYPNASAGSRVTGFTFTSGPAVVTHGSKGMATFRVDHNTFTHGDVMVKADGNASGLIDHNTFTSNTTGNEMIHNEGMGASDASGWSDDVNPGGPDMLFIEDNTFTYNISGNPAYFWGSSAVQAYYGARTVFRHNQCNNVQVDQHGTPGMIGARWWEIYENTFFTGTNSAQCCYMAIRGGSGMIFNNHHTGTNGVTGTISLFEEDSGYPALYQIGRGIGQKASPAYVWGNDSSMPVGSGSSNVAEGRDFVLSDTKPSSMLRQQRSSDTASTTYSYTPYTYPHPLQGSGGGGTGPAAPGGLSAVAK